MEWAGATAHAYWIHDNAIPRRWTHLIFIFVSTSPAANPTLPDLTPLDFYTILDVPGTDPSHYTLRGFVTNSQFYPTIDALRAAFDAGSLGQEFGQTTDADWALVDHKPDLGTRSLESRFAPSSLELGGKRYLVDRANQYVEYMGWTFYLSHSRTLGIMFFDIRFKGERVLYELSLQEALAQYSGFTPKAAGTTYHDTYYSLGVDMYTLVEGFDCSFGATFLNVSYHEGNSTTVNPNAICIFEQDEGFPLSRHFYGGGNSSYAFSRLGVTKGAALIVRAIATIGNVSTIPFQVEVRSSYVEVMGMLATVKGLVVQLINAKA